MKQLKFWHGAAIKRGEQYSVYVAAHSVAHLIRLLEEAGFHNVTRHEVKGYFSPQWGYKMKELVPEPEVGVWEVVHKDQYRKDPERIL